MAGVQAQAHDRWARPKCPHQDGGDMIRTEPCGKRAYVNHSWNSPPDIASSADKPRFDRYREQRAILAHRPGITSAYVDSMWTPRYESNQRSKNHNKSL